MRLSPYGVIVSEEPKGHACAWPLISKNKAIPRLRITVLHSQI